ncbi:MAG: hypothetical protein IKL68_00645 [Clostridia bacterium]|nr:hypothetical protein [Clostridia bacterium]
MLKLDFEQAKINEQKRLKEKINKNKKRIALAMYLIAILVLLLIIVLAVGARMKKPQVIIDNTAVDLKHVNGRLAEYIQSLGNSYNIRYLGQFGAANWNDNPKEATIEYTKQGYKSAIYSKELNKHMIFDGEYAYSILNVYKVILKAKAPVDFETSEYNLVSDFGQRYIADVKIKEGGVEYIYQEYEHKDAKIRYYFVDKDLRYIKIIVGDVERKINVIVDRNTVKKELMELPAEYKYVNS